MPLSKSMHFSYLSLKTDWSGSKDFLECCTELGYVPCRVAINSEPCPKNKAVEYIEKGRSLFRSKVKQLLKEQQSIAALGIVRSGIAIEKEMVEFFIDVFLWSWNKEEGKPIYTDSQDGMLL